MEKKNVKCDQIGNDESIDPHGIERIVEIVEHEDNGLVRNKIDHFSHKGTKKEMRNYLKNQ